MNFEPLNLKLKIAPLSTSNTTVSKIKDEAAPLPLPKPSSLTKLHTTI